MGDKSKGMITKSAKETVAAGAEFANGLTGGEVVLLAGELGAGKTHFAKGVAKGLGVARTVTSPTFTLHNIYEGRLTLNHFDFYRVTEEEAAFLGVDEYFGQKNSVCLIEWAENISGLLPKSSITVKIERIDQNTRSIEIVR